MLDFFSRERAVFPEQLESLSLVMDAHLCRGADALALASQTNRVTTVGVKGNSPILVAFSYPPLPTTKFESIKSPIPAEQGLETSEKKLWQGCGEKPDLADKTDITDVFRSNEFNNFCVCSAARLHPAYRLIRHF